MATTKSRRGTKAKGTKKAVIFSILDQDPKITTEAALKELKRRKVDMGERPQQNYYSAKALWKQERGVKRTRRRRRAQPAVVQPLDVETEVQRRLGQLENDKLKAVIAILLT